MTTAALPPLEPLLRRSAKRTRDIFASSPDDGLKEDEKRRVHSPVAESVRAEPIIAAHASAYLSKFTTNTEILKSYHHHYSHSRDQWDQQGPKLTKRR